MTKMIFTSKRTHHSDLNPSLLLKQRIYRQISTWMFHPSFGIKAKLMVQADPKVSGVHCQKAFLDSFVKQVLSRNGEFVCSGATYSPLPTERILCVHQTGFRQVCELRSISQFTFTDPIYLVFHQVMMQIFFFS